MPMGIHPFFAPRGRFFGAGAPVPAPDQIERWQLRIALSAPANASAASAMWPPPCHQPTDGEEPLRPPRPSSTVQVIGFHRETFCTHSGMAEDPEEGSAGSGANVRA